MKNKKVSISVLKIYLLVISVIMFLMVGEMPTTGQTPASTPSEWQPLAPDSVIINGKIITVDRKFTITQAVAVKDGKIIAVGSNEDVRKLKGGSTKVLDLRGKTMLPGINDAHNHLQTFGLSRPPLRLDLTFPKVKSINDIAQMVGERVKAVKPGEWIQGHGWNEGFLDEIKANPKRDVTRQDLDLVSPNNPVCFTRFCLHVVWVNSKALELAKITDKTSDPPGGKILRDPNTGQPTGVLLETAKDLILSLIPPFSQEREKEAINVAMKEYNALGITSVTDPSVDPKLVRLYNDLYNEGKFTVRMNLLLNWTGYNAPMSFEMLKNSLNYVGTHTGFGDEWLRIAGIKIFADGVPSRKTSWEWDEFIGGGRGSLVVPGSTDEERYNQLVNMIVYAHKNGFQVGVHASGARSIDASVDGFVKAMNEKSWDARHYTIHSNLVSAETAARMAKYSLGVNMQMPIKHAASHILASAIGRERSNYAWPLRTCLNAGVHVTDSSDAPVMYPNWKQGVETAVLRESQATGEVYGLEQRITREEALRLWTIEGAWQNHQEKIKGSIEVGKLADFCVLDEDILAIDAHQISKIPVLMTIVGGKIVYNAKPDYLFLK